MGKQKLLPRQAWDEINVSHERVQTTPQVEMVMPKEMKQIVKLMKKQQKGKKK